MKTRAFEDTRPVAYSELAREAISANVRRLEPIANAIFAVLVGAGLGWLAWEWLTCEPAGTLACSLALVAPSRRPAGSAQAAEPCAASINVERLSAAVDAAYKHGQLEGYAKGFREGGRYGRAMYLAAGMVLGVCAVAAALALGVGSAGA